jgi:hypothetical protein
MFFGAAPLRLMPTVKEHYMEFVRDEFPDLLARYERAYPGVHAPRDYVTALQKRIQSVRERYRFADDQMREQPEKFNPGVPVHQRQLALPL